MAKMKSFRGTIHDRKMSHDKQQTLDDEISRPDLNDENTGTSGIGMNKRSPAKETDETAIMSSHTHNTKQDKQTLCTVNDKNR
ncbi:hypothetical protein RB195_021680 [Necator americanus]|uniref:Uncharacterized protein n=1 Tax=Necator americanus TaxID=51031 RepID=A0ABR1EC69_NECAM